MSAYLLQIETNADAGTLIYSFNQDIKIPSYLLAIAVGDIYY